MGVVVGKKIKGILCTAFATVAVCGGGLAMPATTATHEGSKTNGNKVTHINKNDKTKIKKQNTSSPPPIQHKITFDYDQNKGEVMIGKGDSRMGIDFSGADNTEIYVYNEGQNVVSIANGGYTSPGETLGLARYKSSSYYRDIQLNQTFLARSTFNYCAQGRIDSILSSNDSSNKDVVTFNYQILKCGDLRKYTKPQPSSTYSNGPEPGTIQAFDETATSAAPSDNPNESVWNAIPSEQAQYMKNAADAAGYRSFLAQFNKYKGEPLTQMAENVNATMLGEITYSDHVNCRNSTADSINCPTSDYYWPAPIQTEMIRKGNCVDQAILQYYIMRYLGVPANRLFAAGVDAGGDGYADHEVLLVNTASASQKQNFLVMNDGGPVVNAANYMQLDTLPDGWDYTYVFYDAVNQAGYWETPNNTAGSSAGNQPSRTSKRSMNIG